MGVSLWTNKKKIGSIAGFSQVVNFDNDNADVVS